MLELALQKGNLPKEQLQVTFVSNMICQKTRTGYIGYILTTNPYVPSSSPGVPRAEDSAAAAMRSARTTYQDSRDCLQFSIGLSGMMHLFQAKCLTQEAKGGTTAFTAKLAGYKLGRNQSRDYFKQNPLPIDFLAYMLFLVSFQFQRCWKHCQPTLKQHFHFPFSQ